ncbi:ATP-dependent DNA helicase RecG [Blattabacterium cuenoti]|uniref:ATP-dependent DNA helicase RecG n=1 Tax=Blattabacterium cuenoti TaxID=1653831 RepID=UPI00163C2F74|nr:ATP-dependent DNA helicase RecG [Blattabacterium cuenoti]
MFYNVLKKSIKDLNILSSKKISLLNSELNIYTYEDLLFYFPKKYIQLPKSKNISELLINNTKNFNNFVKILGKITSFKEVKTKKKKKVLIARFEDNTGYVELIWFHKINFYKKIRINTTIIVCGKMNFFQKKIQIIHPNIEYENFSLKKEYSIYPIYLIPKKLKNVGFSNLLLINILKNLIKESKDYIEDFFFQKFLKKKLTTKKEALTQIHFPKSFKKVLEAKYSLKFEELFFMKLFLLSKKSITCSNAFIKIGENFQNFYKNFLPFSLTEEQKKVFKEIWNDLKKPIRMNRLLQGEVGSGKTIIALLAILAAIDNGFQSCIMAPTEVLAIQHYQYIMKMFSKIGVKVSLLTRSTSISVRKKIYNDILKGIIHVIIGTHTLIQKKVQFNNLGLAIIDEQQRFGVRQRSYLCDKNDKKLLPHTLIMTATPIPRTLAKIIYHDLNISIIKKTPSGRKPIKTIHFLDKNRKNAFEIIRNQILKGRQIYIVYPCITNGYKCKSLIEGYKEIKNIFRSFEYQIGILHGQMNSQEKKTQINLFFHGKTKIMICTSVIEVGINVPNATVILIENANFFGLSQLHQLRGRVGRGIHQSYCILTTNENIGLKGKSKIEIMCKTNNGLEIAKKDLQQRGCGDIIGTKQSGKNYFHIVNPIKDYEILKEVFPIAEKFFQKNPNFIKEKKNLWNYQWMKNRFKSLCL